MKKLLQYIVSTSIVLLIACNKQEINKVDQNNTQTVLSTAVIDAFIWHQIKLNHKFEWSTVSDEMVWSALQQSDKMMSVGYQPEGERKVSERLAGIDIKAVKWSNVRFQV